MRRIGNPHILPRIFLGRCSRILEHLPDDYRPAELGLECNPLGQGYGSMGAPTIEFEKLVLTEVSAISMLIEGYIVVL